MEVRVAEGTKIDELAMHAARGSWSQPDQSFYVECLCGEGFHGENPLDARRMWARHAMERTGGMVR